MSNILNLVKQAIAQSIKVEVKSPVTRNNKAKFPIIVTDASASATSGWFIQYNPTAHNNNTRLYDGSETFSDLHIAKFSAIHDLILTANYYFLQGAQVETLSDNRRRAIYEIDAPKIRLTATSQQKSISVTVTITDDASPFHMMSIPFTVVASNTGDGSYYVVGTDKYWDRNTDLFQEFNANFAPRKARFHRVIQQQNQPAILRGAKLAVVNGQYAINQDGTFQIDAQKSSPEYVQVINNQYKALAYIYEQALMEKAFELAIAQGLPVANQAPAPQPGQQPPAPSGFVPAFQVSGLGSPNQNAQFAPPVPPAQPAPLQSAPVHNMNGVEVNPDDLPFSVDQK